MEKKSHKSAAHKSAGAAVAAAAASGVGYYDSASNLVSPIAAPVHHGGSSKHRSNASAHHHHTHSHPQQQQSQSPVHQTHHSNGPTSRSHHNSNANTKTAANAATTELVPHANANTKAASARSKNEEAIHDLRQRIPEIENIFDVHSRIGNGTFSTVLLGTLKKERELPEHLRRKFAIKHHIPTSHPDRIMKELQCMAKIGGTDNVVGINCCIRYNESVAFIMPYMPHDRFHDFFSRMDLIEVQNYMKNLLIALRHVHRFNVIHRDVKPSNFLYNRRKKQFLLVDFGLAQQVPTPQLLVSGNNNNNMCLPQPQMAGSATSTEGKRMREQDEAAASGKISEDPSNVPSDASGAAKRLRCTGPQGDQQLPVTATPSQPNARGSNSCAPMNGSPFKMPLKQLNEISAPGKTTVNCVGSGTSTNSGIYEAPLSRQVKSVVLGATLSQRLQQKLRAQQGQSITSGGGGAGSGTSPVVPTNVQLMAVGSNTAASADATDAAVANNNTSKYNTNRNLSSNSGQKCFCYGNPQVCNICLIKKEIHASRAGTPGYRPPEVLLKYPDQTTAVDIWASGVIFLSILSSVYPFFKAPNDYVALAEMVTIFGDKTIRKTAFILDRLVTLSQKTKPLDLRKLCVRFRNRTKFSAPELLKKYQRSDGSCEVCKNCDQFFFNCLCSETNYNTEPLDADDPFPATAYDLLYKLLEVNPHKRITAEEALNHPFFSLTNANAATLPPTTSPSATSAADKKGRD